MSLTPQEAQTLKDIEAAAARGEDVFGDDEEIVKPGFGDTDNSDQQTAGEVADDDDAATPGDESQTNGDQINQQQADAQQAGDDSTNGIDPAVLDEIANPPAAEPALTAQFKASVPEDYKAKRTELLATKAKAMKDLMDGTIDADAFAEIDAQVSTDLEDLTAQRIRAETLIEANTQTQQAYQQREIQKLIARTKAEVDYTADPKAAKQFDTAMALLVADPDNAGMDFAELIQTTHKMVASMRGVSVAKTQDKQPPPERKPTDAAPVTLRSLPTASTPNSNGNIVDQLARLKGADYERAFSKLSPADRRALLDETEEA
jgi:hypothetical protein